MNTTSSTSQTLMDMYEAMYSAYGSQEWWPAETRIEVMIGAILTQNTNWKNVEKAIAQLRSADLLDWLTLHRTPTEELAQHIRPAGYYNLKAKRLKNLVTWLWDEYDGDFDRIENVPLYDLREQLLRVNGIGRETADAILLYALHRTTFVIDAYTGRIARRHGLIDPEADYERLKALFEDHLPADLALFNEYHALLVEIGKRHCKPRARCEGCPLDSFEHDETVR